MPDEQPVIKTTLEVLANVLSTIITFLFRQAIEGNTFHFQLERLQRTDKRALSPRSR